jgi:demethylmenaquinone methyltransferase/2-methoxy-6-polyprenyl-1,4-benzoquinol methylase
MVDKEKTHFGYQEVPVDEKQSRVKSVFESVANKYDIMNDLMSFGVHRLWKRYTASLSKIKPGQRVLDVASGSGDLAKLFSKRVGQNGHVVLSDINEAMLNVGRENMLNEGIAHNVSYVIANAETLPFKDNDFDCLSIAFGLRNVTDKDKALRSMYRVIKPGGRLLILEFSTPSVPGLKPLYDAYSFSILPLMGKIIANDSESYRYLAESIRMHPAQAPLKEMILNAGFEDCEYHNLTGGIVALHTAMKY